MLVQLFDVKVVTDDSIPSELEPAFGREDSQSETVVLCFGVTADGESVLLRVVDWEASAWFRLIIGERGSEDTLREALERVAVKLRGCESNPEDPSYALARKAHLFDFEADWGRRTRRKHEYVCVRFPHTGRLRYASANRYDTWNKISESVTKELGCSVAIAGVAEERVAPETKFFHDIGASPCGWVEVRAEACRRVAPGHRLSHAAHELACSRAALSARADRDDIAPFRVASVDIECRQKPDGGFPTPDTCPIICIGTVLSRAGSPAQERHVHCLRECSPIDGATVHGGIADELALLEQWRDLVVASDVVVFTGYNVLGFDWKYMVERYNVLVEERHRRAGATDPPRVHNGWVTSPHVANRFPQLCQLKSIDRGYAVAREKQLVSAAMGWNKLFEILCFGRITLDLLMYVKTNYALPRYTLDSVAEHFLGSNKHDITHADIYEYFDGTPDQRKLYCAYCVQDCALPTELCAKLSVLEDFVQTSRVQHTQLSQLVSRGQQIRVFNMLLVYAHARGFVLNRLPMSFQSQEDGEGGDKEDDGYEGATVLDPVPGFYTEPVATLDFASLYPSIMRAHNLCYSTLWTDARPPPEWLRVEHHEGCVFVTDEDHRGVLPGMLDELLAQRSATKKEMGRETDPVRRALLNKKQMAQKVSANSVYGFTGALKKGMYPCKEVARTTTGMGREYIRRTRVMVEEQFGHRVLYGDTDSVMVHLPLPRAEAFARAELIADAVSATFPPAIILEFEKIYCPWLLKGKKRYAGNKSESLGDPGSLDVKGVECVRRDNAPVARSVQKDALVHLVMKSDAAGAIESIRKALVTIVNETATFDQYVITKSLRSEYKNPEALAHARVAAKMEARGCGVPVGGRVEFVVLPGRGKLCERAEHADYALKNRCVLDRMYYIEKQLMVPIVKLFADVMDLAPLFEGALAAVSQQMEQRAREAFLGQIGAHKGRVYDLDQEAADVHRDYTRRHSQSRKRPRACPDGDANA